MTIKVLAWVCLDLDDADDCDNFLDYLERTYKEIAYITVEDML